MSTSKKKGPGLNPEFLINLLERVLKEGSVIAKKFEAEVRTAAKRYWGENIAVVGPVAAGKTTVLRIFKNPSINSEELIEYRQTEVDEIESFKCKWPVRISEEKMVDFCFNFRKSSDVGGEKYIRDTHWETVIKNSKVIFFIVDGEKILKHKNKEYIDSFIDDIRWLGEKVNLLKANFKVIPILNKIDTMCQLGLAYDSFEAENAEELKRLMDKARVLWPKAYRNRLMNFIPCSLLNATMRQDAFVHIIHSIMGDELLNAYKNK